MLGFSAEWDRVNSSIQINEHHLTLQCLHSCRFDGTINGLFIAVYGDSFSSLMCQQRRVLLHDISFRLDESIACVYYERDVCAL